MLLFSLELFSQAITDNLEYQKISGVGYGWRHISFSNTYSDAIVVCSNVLPSQASNEAVVRLNNISATGVDIKIQRPNDVDTGYTTDVYCIISDEGSYTIPIKYEAHKVVSDLTNGLSSPNNWSASRAEDVSGAIINSYTKPAVLGQVMSYNDNRFSTFWSFDCDSRKNRPFQSGMADGICVGKHVGQIAEERANETLGYIVAEAGVYELKDFSMAIDYGTGIKGVGDTPSYTFSLDKAYTEGIVTKEAENGGQGGWAVLYGLSPFGTRLDLAIDEETVAGDTTRTHIGEDVAYWVMLNDPIVSAEMKINEILYQQVTNGSANEEFIEFYVTKSGDLKNYLFTDQDGSSHHYRFPKHSVTKGDYVILHIGSGLDSVSGNVHHFYANSSELLNNTGDEILLLKPVNDDVTVVDGVGISAIPFDYVAYDTIGSGDVAPISQKGVSISWNGSEISRLADSAKGTSISLTPNATDGDTSVCWEITATTDTTKKATNCANYIATIDSNNNANMINSLGETNTNKLLPNIKLEKNSVTVYDPINLAVNPKAIPLATVKYNILLRNEGLGVTDNNSVILQDIIPANMSLCVATIAQCKEIALVEGVVSSGLSLGVVSYSNNGGVTFNYVPTADALGLDSSVTTIKFALDGVFNASDGINHPSATLEVYMGVR